MTKSFLCLPHSSRNTPLLYPHYPTEYRPLCPETPPLISPLSLPCLPLLFQASQDPEQSKASLVSRATECAKTLKIDFTKFLLDNDYFSSHSKIQCASDGVSDSLKQLLTCYNDSAKTLAKMILCPFFNAFSHCFVTWILVLIPGLLPFCPIWMQIKYLKLMSVCLVWIFAMLAMWKYLSQGFHTGILCAVI
jgi:hypothetical protein